MDLVRSLRREIIKRGFSITPLRTLKHLDRNGAIGFFHMKDKEVVYTTHDEKGKKRTKAQVAFILAHELRHIQHFQTGLYKSYYARDFSDRRKLGSFIGVGYRAELDCDKYAKNRLQEAGLKTRLMYRKYPLHKVAGYSAYKGLNDFRAAKTIMDWLRQELAAVKAENIG